MAALAVALSNAFQPAGGLATFSDRVCHPSLPSAAASPPPALASVLSASPFARASAGGGRAEDDPAFPERGIHPALAGQRPALGRRPGGATVSGAAARRGGRLLRRRRGIPQRPRQDHLGGSLVPVRASPAPSPRGVRCSRRLGRAGSEYLEAALDHGYRRSWMEEEAWRRPLLASETQAAPVLQPPLLPLPSYPALLPSCPRSCPPALPPSCPHALLPSCPRPPVLQGRGSRCACGPLSRPALRQDRATHQEHRNIWLGLELRHEPGGRGCAWDCSACLSAAVQVMEDPQYIHN